MTNETNPQFTSSPAQWEKLKPLARQMRHTPTQSEDVLWQQLRSQNVGGAKFRRQHTISGFIVDFVCIEHKLIVEVDGDIHDEPDQKAYDEQRQTLLEALGFRVIRFTNADILDSIETVTEVIRNGILG